MLDEIGIAMIREARGETLDETERRFGLAEQQPARVGRDLPAVERGVHRPRTEALELETPTATLCHTRTVPSWGRKWVVTNSLMLRGTVRFLFSVRNAG